MAPGSAVRHRSPLGDVADLLWSMHPASTVAAAERDPAGRLGLAALGDAWEMRNRRAFVTSYLGTAGHQRAGRPTGLVRRLLSFLELARSVQEASA